MLNINTTLIAGGTYIGDQSWSKTSDKLDQCFKIYFVEEGEVAICGNGQKFTLRANQIYFINGFKIEKQLCEQSFKISWVHFSYHSIILKQFAGGLPVVSKISNANFPNFNAENVFADFFNIDFKKKKELNGEKFANFLKIQSLISLISSELLKNNETTILKEFGDENRIYPAIDYINKNYKQSISLKKLSETCFMSENYFHHLFTKTFNITPNNYILQIRMNEALQLLTNSNLRISEVAVEIGFTDSAYFSRVFSKYYGMSPLRYRKILNVRVP